MTEVFGLVSICLASNSLKETVDPNPPRWSIWCLEAPLSIDNIVLELALQDYGRVRATELALESSLSLDGAQDYLEDLASRGICRMDMDEHGTTCFVFERR